MDIFNTKPKRCRIDTLVEVSLWKQNTVIISKLIQITYISVQHSYTFLEPGPPIESMIRGRMHVPIFSGKGAFFGRSLGKISRGKPGKGVFFVIANGNQYPK